MPYEQERHGPRRVVGPGFHERVYAIVRTVPAGLVTTYGDVAAQLGLRSVARHVGYALAALEPRRDDVPWHRVVNGTGRISARGTGTASSEQRRRLVDEGIEVAPDGRVQGFRSVRHVF